MTYTSIKNKRRMIGKRYIGMITHSITKSGNKVAWVKLDPRLEVQDVRISQNQLERYQITPDRFPNNTYVMIPITNIGGHKTRYRLSTNGCGIKEIMTSKDLDGTELDVSTTNLLDDKYRTVGGYTKNDLEILEILESLEY